jgi:hypothetical protein
MLHLSRTSLSSTFLLYFFVCFSTSSNSSALLFQSVVSLNSPVSFLSSTITVFMSPSPNCFLCHCSKLHWNHVLRNIGQNIYSSTRFYPWFQAPFASLSTRYLRTHWTESYLVPRTCLEMLKKKDIFCLHFGSKFQFLYRPVCNVVPMLPELFVFFYVRCVLKIKYSLCTLWSAACFSA